MYCSRIRTGTFFGTSRLTEYKDGQTGPDYVQELLEGIRERVMVYYSAMNYAQASPEMAATLERPHKPEELILLDDLFGLSMSILQGGYVDQPWLVTQMLIAAAQARETGNQSRMSVTASEE